MAMFWHNVWGPSTRRGLQLLLALPLLAAVAGAFGYAQWQALDLLQAVAAGPIDRAGAAPDLFGTATPMTSEILVSLERLFNAVPGDPVSALLDLNLRWLGQVGFSLMLVLPAGLIIATLAYLSAVLLATLYRRGAAGSARLLDTVLDALPYALWMLPLLGLAYALQRHLGPSVLPYWAYLGLIFLGFGAFLLPFFIHSNLRRLRALERAGVLDGERVTGGSALGIWLRLWRFELRRPFAYQVFYCALFIVLLEYSSFTILQFNQTGQRWTTFTQANVFSERGRDGRARTGDPHPRATYAAALAALVAAVPETRAQDWAGFARANPFAPLAVSVREAGPEWFFRHRDALPDAAAQAVLQGLEVTPAEQNQIYFEGLAAFWFWLNAALVFGAFGLLLVFFDVPGLFEERDG